MVDEARLVDGVVEIMKNFWDLPADCNEGELIGFAEALLHHIRNGEGVATLEAYLADVQTRALEMPASEASGKIVGEAMALAGRAV